jgi:hypothetical protein
MLDVAATDIYKHLPTIYIYNNFANVYIWVPYIWYVKINTCFHLYSRHNDSCILPLLGDKVYIYINLMKHVCR